MAVRIATAALVHESEMPSWIDEARIKEETSIVKRTSSRIRAINFGSRPACIGCTKGRYPRRLSVPCRQLFGLLVIYFGWFHLSCLATAKPFSAPKGRVFSQSILSIPHPYGWKNRERILAPSPSTRRGELPRCWMATEIDGASSSSLSSLSSPSQVWDVDDIVNYLHDIRDVVEESSTFSFTLNEKQHLKGMMRAILGYTKAEFSSQLRTVSTQRQWAMAQDLVTKLRAVLQPIIDPEEAPQFLSGLDNYRYYESNPLKLFSVLARGRTFQGQFDRLLDGYQSTLAELDLNSDGGDDTYTQLKQQYDDIRIALPDRELLKYYVKQLAPTTDKATIDMLQQCMQVTFRQQSAAQSLDGGKSSGEKGEMGLVDYLQQQRTGSMTSNGANDHPQNQSLCLTPVWIQSARNVKNNQQKRRPPNVLQVPNDCMRSGTTSEFDAMVVVEAADAVEENGNDLELVEVWEAKASIDPASLYDALTKKAASLEHIFVRYNDTNDPATNGPSCTTFPLLLDDQVHSLRTTRTTTKNQRLPFLFGIYGNKLLTPRKAARRLETVVVDMLLETDVETVQAVLAEGNGILEAPVEPIVEQLKRLIALVRKVKPVLVVPPIPR